MNSLNNSIKKSSYKREQPPGILEKIGVYYYRYLAQKSGIGRLENTPIDDLPDDITLQTLANNLTVFAVMIAFAIGALTSFVTVWVEWTYHDRLQTVPYYLLYGSVLLAMLISEMAVLFWLGLKIVYSLACLTGHHQSTSNHYLPGNEAVPNILARAALEIPDPVIHYLGIDPLKHLSKSKLFLVAFLYKAKVFLSSLAVKFVLIRLFGKGETRTAFNWVAIPVTGLWDAFTLYKVANEARLRLFGHKLAAHIAYDILTDALIEQLSPKAREGAIRAIATMMVLAQNYHPNLLVLLVRLCETFNIEDQSDYDDWDSFLRLLGEISASERYFLLDILSVSAAFDGHLSSLEKHHLPEAFKELTDIYMARTEKLKNCLLNGQLHAAKDLCGLDFKPG